MSAAASMSGSPTLQIFASQYPLILYSFSKSQNQQIDNSLMLVGYFIGKERSCNAKVAQSGVGD